MNDGLFWCENFNELFELFWVGVMIHRLLLMFDFNSGLCRRVEKYLFSHKKTGIVF
jgi:hypothetical protein